MRARRGVVLVDAAVDAAPVRVAPVEEGLSKALLGPLGRLFSECLGRQVEGRLLGRLGGQGWRATLIRTWTTLPAVVSVRATCKDSEKILSFLGSLDYHVKVLELILCHGIPHDQLVDSWLETIAKS
jgi:hypothetical protein